MYIYIYTYTYMGIQGYIATCGDIWDPTRPKVGAFDKSRVSLV